MSNKPSELTGHVSRLYEIAHGLRFMYQGLDDQNHDVVGPLRLMSEKLLDIASDFDDASPILRKLLGNETTEN